MLSIYTLTREGSSLWSTTTSSKMYPSTTMDSNYY